MMKKWTACLLSFLLLFGSFAMAETVGETRNITVAMLPEKEINLFPYQAYSSKEQRFLSSMVFDTLVELDRDGVRNKSVAEDYEIDDDYTVYTVQLREGLFWHDEWPVTVNDIVFSYEYAKASDVQYYSYAASQPAEIVAVDDRTIEFRFTQSHPNYVTEGLAVIPIIPKHIYEEETDQIIGSGGYKLQSMDEKGIILVSSGLDYYRERLIDSMTVVFVEDEQTAIEGLREDVYDSYINTILTDTKQIIKGRADLSSVDGDGLCSEVFVMNNALEPFSDEVVRQAISQTLDYGKIVDEVYDGVGKVGKPGFINGTMQFANRESEYRTNVSGASKLLEDNGYLLEGKIRMDKNGNPMEYTLAVTDESQIPLANEVSKQISNLGIALTVEVNETAMDFQTKIMSLSADYQWNEAGLMMLLTAQNPEWNIANYQSEAFAKLETAYNGTVNGETRLKLLQDMQLLVEEDVPFITLCYPGYSQVYNYLQYNGYVEQYGTGIFFKGSFYENAKTQALMANENFFKESTQVLNPVIIAAAVLALVAFTAMIWYYGIHKRKE